MHYISFDSDNNFVTDCNRKPYFHNFKLSNSIDIDEYMDIIISYYSKMIMISKLIIGYFVSDSSRFSCENSDLIIDYILIKDLSNDIQKIYTNCKYRHTGDISLIDYTSIARKLKLKDLLKNDQ